MAKLKIKSGFSLGRIDLVAKGLSSGQFLGNYKSVFKGTGLEFDSFRKYNPGNDDASQIDWKASKRINQLLVREFIEERNIDVTFLIDCSTQMLTGSTDKLKAEYMAEFVASLSRNILDAGDPVGFILFSNEIIKEIRPDRGSPQFFKITKNLIETSNYKGYSDIDMILDYAFKSVKTDSLLILVSDFVYGFGSEKLLKQVSKKFDLIMVMIRDPRDMTIPEGGGEVVLEDPYSGNTLLITPDRIRKEYKKDNLAEITRMENTLEKYGGEFLFLQTDKPFVREVIKFFKRREAKWR